MSRHGMGLDIKVIARHASVVQEAEEDAPREKTVGEATEAIESQWRIIVNRLAWKSQQGVCRHFGQSSSRCRSRYQRFSVLTKVRSVGRSDRSHDPQTWLGDIVLREPLFFVWCNSRGAQFLGFWAR